MRRLLFAANWKMHLGPDEAREYLKSFLPAYSRIEDRDVWFFAPAVSLEAVAHAIRGRDDLRAGAQNIHWESQGAFTGEISGPLAARAGARATLVGHSERRQLFGETDEQTSRKLAAALNAELVPVLCVGETLAEREQEQTIAVVTRQLGAALRGEGEKNHDDQQTGVRAGVGHRHRPECDADGRRPSASRYPPLAVGPGDHHHADSLRGQCEPQERRGAAGRAGARRCAGGRRVARPVGLGRACADQRALGIFLAACSPS